MNTRIYFYILVIILAGCTTIDPKRDKLYPVEVEGGPKNQRVYNDRVSVIVSDTFTDSDRIYSLYQHGIAKRIVIETSYLLDKSGVDKNRKFAITIYYYKLRSTGAAAVIFAAGKDHLQSKITITKSGEVLKKYDVKTSQTLSGLGNPQDSRAIRLATMHAEDIVESMKK